MKMNRRGFLSSIIAAFAGKLAAAAAPAMTIRQAPRVVPVIRKVTHYDPINARHFTRFDVLYGVATVRPEICDRVDLEFLSGEQWSEDEIRKRREHKPAGLQFHPAAFVLTYPRIEPRSL